MGVNDAHARAWLEKQKAKTEAGFWTWFSWFLVFTRFKVLEAALGNACQVPPDVTLCFGNYHQVSKNLVFTRAGCAFKAKKSWFVLENFNIFSIKFVLENLFQQQTLSFLDATFQVNVTTSQCLPTKYRLSEFSPGITGIRGIRGNATNRASRDLCSTRTGSKDDGS